MRVLLQKHADPGAEDDGGRTCAMLASMGGHVNCLRVLLQEMPWGEVACCSLDAKDKSGRTAAMWAAEFGQESCLRLLADIGADLDIRDREGQTAASVAAAAPHFSLERHEPCLRFLAERGGD